MLRQTICLLLLCICVNARAHEGHDHADEAAPVINNIAPRIAASSDELELLAIVAGNQLQVYVDRIDSNQPLIGAKLELEVAGKTRRAVVSGDHYLLEAPWLLVPGRHLLVFSVESAQISDLLPTEYSVPIAAVSRPAALATRLAAQPLLTGIGAALFIGLMLLLIRRWRKGGRS